MTNSLSRERDRAAAHMAMQAASYATGVSMADIALQTRGAAKAAAARQLAMYLTHVGFEMSLARVALAFGRDRSTVSHACHTVEDRRDDPAFDACVSALEEMLQAAPAPGAADAAFGGIGR